MPGKTQKKAPNRQTSPGRGFVWLGLILVVLGIGAAAYFAGGLSEGQKRALSDAAADITKVKDEAEQWAGRIRRDYAKGSKQYETAYTKYIPAKAATDAWLDRFVIDLSAHRDISSSDEYAAALQAASAKGEDFLRYARSLYEGPENKSGPLNLIASLTEAGLKIWKEFRSASNERIEEAKKAILSLKWKSFEET